ncbi:MAG: anti-sigma factor domain-containing protein [Chitinophagales bacterium]
MNIREYILSGIIESYVLGLTSLEEGLEFERICAAHPEVRAARDAFEKQVEDQLQMQGVAPPRELKSRIFSQIGMEQTQVKPEPGIPLNRPVLIRQSGFPRFVAAASLILLLGSILLNLYLLSQYKHSIAQYKELLVSQEQLTNANQSMNTKLETYESAISLMKNPRMTIVKMPGVPTSPAPSSMATVYWNTNSREVYLLINQLPKPVTGMQYQLWAIVDGKPVDAGVFDLAEGPQLMKLKTIPNAQAFAITLEKQGGSETPTMAAMYVMGKVTG